MTNPACFNEIRVHYKKLSLIQFRNYDSLEVDWAEHVNCITGRNGTGKTNILEALHYPALARGFHSRKDKTAVREGCGFFMNKIEIKHPSGIESVECNFLPSRGKSIIVDGQQLEKMSRHIGTIPMVTVLPSDTRIVDDGPAVRRRFMDLFISQYDNSYLEDLIRYERAMAQRSALLNEFSGKGGPGRAELEPWDHEMTKAGIGIRKVRESFVKQFRKPFSKYYKMLVPDSETQTLRYLPSIADNSEEGWKKEFEKNLQRDCFTCRSNSGAHCEDLEFLINGRSARVFASQGQRKTFVIALKLAQYEMLRTKSGKAPILLLDDLFDKLDDDRLSAIADIIRQQIAGQVFVTDTSYGRTKAIFGAMKNRSVAYYKVENNQIKYEKGK